MRWKSFVKGGFYVLIELGSGQLVRSQLTVCDLSDYSCQLLKKQTLKSY